MTINFTQPVYARPDGTYVVIWNGMPFHVLEHDPFYLDDDERAHLFEKVQVWIAAGGQTQIEPPPPPVQSPTIQQQLAELDSIVSRDVEDMYAELGKTPALQARVDAIAKKRALRTALKSTGAGS